MLDFTLPNSMCRGLTRIGTTLWEEKSYDSNMTPVQTVVLWDLFILFFKKLFSPEANSSHGIQHSPESDMRLLLPECALLYYKIKYTGPNHVTNPIICPTGSGQKKCFTCHNDSHGSLLLKQQSCYLDPDQDFRVDEEGDKSFVHAPFAYLEANNQFAGDSYRKKEQRQGVTPPLYPLTKNNMQMNERTRCKRSCSTDGGIDQLVRDLY